jgi:hypothetical protein
MHGEVPSKPFLDVRKKIALQSSDHSAKTVYASEKKGPKNGAYRFLDYQVYHEENRTRNLQGLQCHIAGTGSQEVALVLCLLA